ncbi:LOW QUALITY PROTEIN: senecionine N-oxygenase [Drosophila nasuta]|uniref:LOW QUALITY PROTEIN: senecionine N-oxygenase n=1 Tax=Drosophila nasuta TaxID=42062 RepID=UPI00295EEAB0|nr:LOW QUALITY PROTEIN: senecionine N-oxygenase [Drosophila nasuta]
MHKTPIHQKRRVCVIGAGTAGLCALKNSLQEGLDAVAYERGSEVGGTWIFSEEMPKNKYDEVHSSMYQGLRTNLPKEVMGYPDYHYPTEIEESFITSHQVLNFLRSYADHFKLHPHIKLQHEVIRVRPRQNDWEVYVWDHNNNTCDPVYYDFVYVCNGHYTEPDMPKIEGMQLYEGQQMHSHLYRKADKFKDQNVLVIGAGPSGMDITNHIRQAARHVYLSHHLATTPNTAFMGNVTQKPDVERFTKDGAVFKDGSSESFDHVMYCTGYQYSFPCLSTDVGIQVIDNFVQPLWKHCININHPTMSFIGLPFNVIPTHIFDMQVRFTLKFYTGQRELPNKEEMLAELEKEQGERWDCGFYNRKKAHQMGERQFVYYNELARMAGIDNIKPVILKLMKDCGKKYIFELDTYRNNRYRIVDDENFLKNPL